MRAEDTLLVVPQGTEPQTTLCRHCAFKLAQAVHSFNEGVKVGLSRHRNPLDAPCVFCGYNGAGYWQRGTHSSDCPLYGTGGADDRLAKLRELLDKISKTGGTNGP